MIIIFTRVKIVLLLLCVLIVVSFRKGKRKEVKKILIVSNVSGGLFSFRRELIERISKNNEVIILASNTGHVEDFKRMGCEFVNVSMEFHGTNPITELKLISKYKNKIKSIAPDIVLTYTIKPNIYAGIACASLNIPYVANITGLGIAVENSGFMQKPMLCLYKYGLRKAQKVFFQNQSNVDFMINHKIVTGPYELIPGSGVNLERYQLMEYPKGDTIDFVFIARIIKEKGIDQYLDAAKFIRNKYPNTRFHVCGSCGSAYKSVLDELTEDGTIIYHGIISDVVGIHKISYCTIHPTYYPEGMSNVLLESCACGRPIITTDRPGCREIVDDGINGFVVKQQDSSDLIEKVQKFLELSWEKKRKMGLAGREKMEKSFDRNIVIQKYLKEIG